MSRQHGMTRLYVEADLSVGAALTLDGERAKYLTTVLRARAGEAILLFNVADGEWQARLKTVDRHRVSVEVECQRRQAPQLDAKRPLYLGFALVKRAAAETIVQKATELGVDVIQPMRCERSVRGDIRPDRMEAIAIVASCSAARASSS